MVVALVHSTGFFHFLLIFLINLTDRSLTNSLSNYSDSRHKQDLKIEAPRRQDSRQRLKQMKIVPQGKAGS